MRYTPSRSPETGRTPIRTEAPFVNRLIVLGAGLALIKIGTAALLSGNFPINNTEVPIGYVPYAVTFIGAILVKAALQGHW